MVDARGVWALCSEGFYCFHAPSGAHAFTQAYSHAHTEIAASGSHADGYTQNDDSPDTWVWVAENCHHPDIVRWLTKSQAPVKRQANAEISNDQLPGYRRGFCPLYKGSSLTRCSMCVMLGRHGSDGSILKWCTIRFDPLHFLSMGKKFGHVYRACRTIRGLGIMALLYESLERGVRYPGSVSN